MKVLHVQRGQRSTALHYRETLNALEPFRTTTALCGNKEGFSFHALPRNWRGPLEGAWEKFIGNIGELGAFAYTVWSYRMPIAWAVHTGEGVHWYVPDVKYSSVTSRHQRKIREALDIYSDVPELPEGVFLERYTGPRCTMCDDRADYLMRLSWTAQEKRHTRNQDMCAACVLRRNREFREEGSGTISVVQEYA